MEDGDDNDDNDDNVNMRNMAPRNRNRVLERVDGSDNEAPIKSKKSAVSINIVQAVKVIHLLISTHRQLVVVLLWPPPQMEVMMRHPWPQPTNPRKPTNPLKPRPVGMGTRTQLSG